MVMGHIPDYSHVRIELASWMEGPPEISRWLRVLKIGGKKRFALSAYRCPACGKVELYAINEMH